MRKLSIILLAVGLAGLAWGEEELDDARWYAGAAGGVLLPGNGNSLRRGAMAGFRCGRAVDEFLALEVEAWAAPNVSCATGHADLWGVTAQGVWHLSGWELFDKLFGCERFDPFVTGGVQFLGASRRCFADDSHRTGTGPVVGLGAFYHLTDEWSVRGEVRAALTIDSPCGMVYSALLGVQFEFGG